MAKKRPIISSINETASSSIEERFQNKTLRPIVKMQHDLLIAFFQHYLSNKKVTLQNLSDQQKIDIVSRSFKQDIPFRNELKGLIIGHFTIEEYQEYLTAQRELNKRIFRIVEQRLCSSLDQL